VWCKNDECRIPAFRCMLCRSDCYEMRVRSPEDALGRTFEILRNSGKFKEHFVMRRKDGGKISDGQLSFLEKDQKEQVLETEEQKTDNGVFILDNGRIEPVSADSYTASTLYRTVDSFSVECRLVKPEEPGSMLFEGKKPSKKTVPILVGRDGECVLLNSWEELESEPSRLSNAHEVLGALPVKQVFVLKRK
ncbi:MAG: hypothetical protein M1398_02550, partial [Deltaproteobacteria bacterium]|nr:hypothetical protein [Deltaproteobacteria bacterium]